MKTSKAENTFCISSRNQGDINTMGIVVTVFMLLALLMVSPIAWFSLGALKTRQPLANFIGFGLLLTGLWNALWHGLRYLNDFWGIAGLISGIFMVCVAVIILNRYASENIIRQSVLTTIYKGLKPISIFCTTGLFLSFLLYAITLIRLNLGMSIL